MISFALLAVTLFRFFWGKSIWSSSSSSSSPLLSLVQVPAKLAINLSIHTQHTYDNNGVDRTGDRVFRNTAFYMRRERRKKNFLTPDYAPFGVQSENRKKNTSAQKHIYHKHMTLQRGKHIQLWQAAIRSSAMRRRSQTCSP